MPDMRKASIWFLAFALAFMSMPPLFAQVDPSGNLARNPIIWADVPDLAAIRVGDTYYMSSTTMHMSPGLPIMKSKDLVNWQIVGYAYRTLGDNDALTLRHGKSAYGAGSWASSLRHHEGTFYATTFSNTTGKDAGRCRGDARAHAGDGEREYGHEHDAQTCDEPGT